MSHGTIQYEIERKKLTPLVMKLKNQGRSMRSISKELKMDPQRVKRIIFEFHNIWFSEKDKRFDRKGKTHEQIFGKEKALIRKNKFIKSMEGKTKGSKNGMWQGGITPKRFKIRNSNEYAEWRKKVFERDNHQCTYCDKRNKKGSGNITILHSHHILPFSRCLSKKELNYLIFDVNNGITLCKECHYGRL